MNYDLFSLREEEIFRTLQSLRDCHFVIIGGYGVNTYTLPRFSVDCDIVIKDESEAKKIEKILPTQGYKKQEFPKGIPYAGDFVRYEKILQKNFSVSMDILISHVHDRMTGVVFSADWIFQHTKQRSLKGKTITQELQVRIIDIDALVVMKIISCRSTDIRDVFMMLPYVKNKERIESEVNLRYSLQEKIQIILTKIESKQFKDGLAGVYGQFDTKVFEKHKKTVRSLAESL